MAESKQPMPLFLAHVSFSEASKGIYLLEAENLIAAHIQMQEKIEELNRRIRAKLPEADGEYATIQKVSRFYGAFLTDEEIGKIVDKAEYIEVEDE